MNTEIRELVAEYRKTGTLTGLPDRHIIGGRKVASVDRLECFDPGLARPFHQISAGGKEEVDLAVAAAQEALASAWGRMSPSERGAILLRAAALIRAEAPRLSVVESLDVGKTLPEAQGDVAGVARCFEYYGGAADKLEGTSLPLGPVSIGYTLNEPIGVTAHIVPWNYPLSTLARSLAPALAAGCTAVVKPAETTSLTSLMLAEILARAGIPDGVVNIVLGTGASAGAPLVSHHGIHHVTFTGSVETGVGVMRAAAANVTSVVLELGGKSPAIVLADADLDHAATDIAGAIFENAGQICSAASRLIVDRRVHEQLVTKLIARAQALSFGHGLRSPDMGAVNSAAHLARITGHVAGARSRGLSPVTGGEAATDPETGQGWFFQPTIFDSLAGDDPLVQEEIFGPVLTVQVVDDADHAITLANGTRFALVAGVYTKDLQAAHRLARDIDAGQVFINEYFAGGIMAPFGGNRQSGFGREKGMQALQNYCKLKTVTASIGS